MTEHIDRGLKKMGITISKPFLAILCIISGILIILFKSSRMDSWTVSVDSRILLLTEFIELER